jgi:glycosyltransferase involved in cell wall biosynthesis
MWPFVSYGKWLARKSKFQNFDLVFFFNCYDLGGGEKVNADIIRSVPDKKILIIFSRKSHNGAMKHYFEGENIQSVDLSPLTDNKFKYWKNVIQRGYVSGIINKMTVKPTVFISQCNFGYKTTPYIRKDILITELIHMYHKQFMYVWAPFISYIHKRIVINPVVKHQFLDSYHQLKVPTKYTSRFHIIEYMVDIPNDLSVKEEFTLPLKLYYAGRGGPQKRLWILMEIIRKSISLDLPIEFLLAGSFENEIPQDLKQKVTYLGEIKGSEAMGALYKRGDVLVMTSDWEGYPLVIMESTIYGNIPLVTSVGGIPEHLKDGVNGFLIENTTESELVEKFIHKIKYIIEHKAELSNISRNTRDYSLANFSAEVFQKKYRAAFELL